MAGGSGLPPLASLPPLRRDEPASMDGEASSVGSASARADEQTAEASEPSSNGNHKLTLLQAIGLNTMNMFGTGPLISIPYCLASVTPGGTQCMIGYSFALVACWMDSLVWAELGHLWPKSGGSYLYLRECYGSAKFGRCMAFVFVWTFIVSGPAELAAGFIAIVEYGAFFFQGELSYALRVCLSLSLVLVTVCLLFRKTTDQGRIGLVLWAITVAVIIFTCVTGFSSWDVRNLRQVEKPTRQQLLWSVTRACRFGIFDMSGYFDVNSMGDEVHNPERTIPVAGVSTAFTLGGAFVLVYMAVLGMQPYTDYIYMFADDYDGVPKGIMSIVIEARFGNPVLTGIVTAFAMITIFGATFAQMCGYSHVPYAAARDGYFFSWLGHRSHKYEGLADYSLLALASASCFWCFFNMTLVVDVFTTLLVVVQFMGQSAGLLWYRYKNPDIGGWRMPLYPLPCLIQLSIFSWVFLSSPSMLLYGSREPILELSLTVIALGVILFLVWSRAMREWPFNGKEPSVVAEVGEKCEADVEDTDAFVSETDGGDDMFKAEGSDVETLSPAQTLEQSGSDDQDTVTPRVVVQM